MAPTRKSNASIPDIETLLQAGINPKTGLPIKMGDAYDSARKQAIKASLRILDEQNAVNRYRWYNLPCNISSNELERLLYYKGQVCFFYMQETDEFYFMPYALDGTIDFYGRFNTVHPVPMANGTSETPEDVKKMVRNQMEVLSSLKLDVLYDAPIEPLKFDRLNKVCVLLHDYTKQMSQTIIARQQIQDPILDIMADCIPFMRTALLNSTGVQGMRVNSQDEESNVQAANRSIDRAALNGKKWVPIVSNIEFQELTGGKTLKSEEFLLAMQGLDNYRLSLYGLSNGGLFQKKAHMLEAEENMNSGNVGLIMDDGLVIRQRFCDIVNSVWGLGISCEMSETVLNVDNNMDGVLSTEYDQSGSYNGDQDEQAAQGGAE